MNTHLIVYVEPDKIDKDIKANSSVSIIRRHILYNMENDPSENDGSSRKGKRRV